MRVLVTGCAGYVGVPVTAELLAAGHDVVGLDVLLHGQDARLDELRKAGVEVVVGDIRDADARSAALRGGVDAIVHLAAIVGDPACARSPELARSVNVDASFALAADAAACGVARFVMASTCSNYGRMADPTVAIDETGVLAPVSLYARQKVAVEEHLLALDGGLAVTCLRFATVYGVAPRMRFDLTVNEFTRDFWAGRRLEVFGEQFWRPYVHVTDAARAVAAALAAPLDAVAGEVFNVGDSGENYRKLDLVEVIRAQLGPGDVVFVARDEDPRDYRVSFEKIAARLGFGVRMRVPQGVSEVIEALEAGAFPEPFDERYRNTP